MRQAGAGVASSVPDVAAPASTSAEGRGSRSAQPLSPNPAGAALRIVDITSPPVGPAPAVPANRSEAMHTTQRIHPATATGSLIDSVLVPATH